MFAAFVVFVVFGVFVVLVNGRRRGGGTPRGLPHEHAVPHTHVVSDRGESQVAVNLSPAMITLPKLPLPPSLLVETATVPG